MAMKSSEHPDLTSKDPNQELKRLMLYCTELEFQNRQLRDNQVQLEKHAQNLFRQFSDAPVALLELDGFGVIQQVNQTAQDLIGRPTHQIAKHVITEFAHPSDRQTLTLLFSKARRVGVGRDEIRVINRDGTEHAVEVILRCNDNQDDPKRTHASMMLIDRSEDNQQSQDLDVQAEELHHRMKNDLALVDGIVDQCLRENTNLADVRQKIRGRLKALASSHVAMDLGRRGGCSLSLLIEHTLKPFDQLDQFKGFEATFDPALPPAIVTPLALVLHELASLSMQNGALSLPTGQVELAVASQQDNTLLLTWMETGMSAQTVNASQDQRKPDPHNQDQTSLLIRKLVEYQMHGEISFESLPDGLRVMMSIPMSQDEPLTT